MSNKNNIVTSHHLYINSNQRLTGTSDAFTLGIKRPFKLTNNNNYFQVIIENAIIPHTIQQVNSNNNTVNLIIMLDPSTLFYSGSITLIAGNYNILTLLNELLNEINPILTTLGRGQIFTITYSKSTGLISASFNDKSNQATFTLQFSQNLQLGLMFGCTGDLVCDASQPSTIIDIYGNYTSFFTGNQPVNVNPITYICLRSGNWSQKQSFENIYAPDVDSNILCTIGIQVNPGCFIFHKSSYPTKINDKIIDNVNIYLTDNLNNALSLNGLEWSLHIIVEEVQYEEIKPDDLLHNYIQPTQPIDTQPLELEKQKVIAELMEAQRLLADEINKHFKNNLP